MNFLNNKKGIVTHPGFLFVVAFVLGVVLTILWAKQYIAIPFPFCGP